MNASEVMPVFVAGAALGAGLAIRQTNKWISDKLEIEPTSNVYEYVIQARHSYDMRKAAEAALSESKALTHEQIELDQNTSGSGRYI